MSKFEASLCFQVEEVDLKSTNREQQGGENIINKVRPVSGISRFALWSSWEATHGDSMVIKSVWLDRDSVWRNRWVIFFSLFYLLFFVFIKSLRLLSMCNYSFLTRLESRNYQQKYFAWFLSLTFITWLSGWSLSSLFEKMMMMSFNKKKEFKDMPRCLTSKINTMRLKYDLKWNFEDHSIWREKFAFEGW